MKIASLSLDFYGFPVHDLAGLDHEFFKRPTKKPKPSLCKCELPIEMFETRKEFLEHAKICKGEK